MLLTEKEARGKWCPHVRLRVLDRAHAETMAFNRVVKKAGPHDARDDVEFTHCIGSGCSQWRWPAAGSGQLTNSAGERVGYCGLAGRPED